MSGSKDQHANAVPATPYLSVVVTTRNDDHGGDLLRRTQAFVNALFAQVGRHCIPTELVMVEWNPPAERPRLRDALRWPAERDWCQVRFIEVPGPVHERYKNAQMLPLYQMIGKNVGIRRAAGEFVLATNIDILFSDALMTFLAARCLARGRMYRIDRHDAMADVPVDAPVDAQLAYCETHLLRVHAREGTFGLNSAGVSDEIAKADARIAGPPPTPLPPAPPPLGFFGKVAGVARRAAEEDGPAIPVWVPVPRAVRSGLRLLVRPPEKTPEEEVHLAEVKSEARLRLPKEVHTNACGDFTLMARSDWLSLRGYPEWDMYSFHIDSVLCLAAQFGGICEVILEEPMRIYHIEHGSGWTPESQQQLFERLRQKGIGWLDFEDLVHMAWQMRRLESPMIFNQKGWGLADYELPETGLV